MDIREQIKVEMSDWFGLDLTEEQITDVQQNVNLPYDVVDTLERGDIINHIAKKITGMGWPCNGDPSERKETFYKLLESNASNMGYNFK